MAQFNSISNWLQEKCEENNNLQKYSYHLAVKYIDFAKHEFRSLNAHEENIMLKLDIGYLQSTYREVVENSESQTELQSLLNEFYNEYLKFSFEVDECELEKLATYDEIKLEFETRESMNIYQRIYDRKAKVIKSMEERNIVKKYKEAEQEYLDTETQQLHHEEHLKKLKSKNDEFKKRRIEESELIFQLVKGWKELEERFANKSQPLSQSQIIFSNSQRLSQITPPKLPTQKGGLSSKLLLNFKNFKISSKHSLPIIQQINHKSGLNRLLQQSEAIRKSMQTGHITLSCEYATPKLPGILKIPISYPKSGERFQKSQKSVSFEIDLPNSVPESMEIKADSAKTSENIDSTCSETFNDFDMKEGLVEEEPKKPKIDIIENLLIKPADKTSNTKLKIEQKPNQSSPKEKLSVAGPSNDVKSKSFLEMFMDMSNEEDSEVKSPAFEPVFDTKPTTVISKSKKETGSSKQTSKSKAKASMQEFGGFDDFLSQFAGPTSETKEDEELDAGNDMSFDFFQSNDVNDDEEGDNNVSFEF